MQLCNVCNACSKCNLSTGMAWHGVAWDGSFITLDYVSMYVCVLAGLLVCWVAELHVSFLSLSLSASCLYVCQSVCPALCLFSFTCFVLVWSVCVSGCHASSMPTRAPAMMGFGVWHLKQTLRFRKFRSLQDGQFLRRRPGLAMPRRLFVGCIGCDGTA